MNWYQKVVLWNNTIICRKYLVKDWKQKNSLWNGEFKLYVVLITIGNEPSLWQAARKYEMYLSSGGLNDTRPQDVFISRGFMIKSDSFKHRKIILRIQLDSFDSYTQWDLWFCRSYYWAIKGLFAYSSAILFRKAILIERRKKIILNREILGDVLISNCNSEVLK